MIILPAIIKLLIKEVGTNTAVIVKNILETDILFLVTKKTPRIKVMMAAKMKGIIMRNNFY